MVEPGPRLADDVPEAPEDEEITLADIVRVLHRRKLVLLTVFVVSVVAGAGFTILATPEYEATATVIPLEHGDIIRNWLDSRHAGELTVAALGTPIKALLFPGRWDDEANRWIGSEPSTAEAARELGKAVSVGFSTGRVSGQNERLIGVTVTLSDPVLARDVANGYIASLSQLRPELENITRQNAFDQYYDGSNEQEAQNRAEVTARQKTYWIELDSALTPSAPSSPNVTLNIALSVVLGLVLGVLAVFFVEWLSNYRAETRRIQVPEAIRLEETEPRGRSREAAADKRPERRYS